MIYLDSSVALAHLLAEDRAPPRSFWQKPLTSSRLLQYEIWSSLRARGIGRLVGAEARALTDQVAFIEMEQNVLARALEPFAKSLRTLDALHLASLEYVRRRGQSIELASYDERLRTVAAAMAIPLADC